MKIIRIVKIAVYSLLTFLFFILVLGIGFIRLVTVDGKSYDPSAEELILLSDSDLRDDSDYAFLSFFPRLKALDIRDLNISNKGYKSIVSQVENDVKIKYDVKIGEKKIPCDTEELCVTNEMVAGVDNIVETMDCFRQLKSFYANDFSSVEDLYNVVSAVKKNNNNAFFQYSTMYKGIHIDETTKELILNDMELKDTDSIEKIIELFPAIKKYEMCDCGLTDSEMETLRNQYPQIEFVWMLHILKYNIRTDAQCFSTLVSNWVGYGDEIVFDPLFRYCTELRALDLGHWEIKSIDGIANLKHLQVLILADNKISDLSPLSGLTELQYLDLRVNNIKDLSPLLSLQNLEILGIGANKLNNPEVLVGLKNLRKLHICRVAIPTKSLNILKKELPKDCRLIYLEQNYMEWYSGYENTYIKKQFFRWKRIKEYHKYDDVVLYDVRPYKDKEQ